jgi:hypothetical protein
LPWSESSRFTASSSAAFLALLLRRGSADELLDAAVDRAAQRQQRQGCSALGGDGVADGEVRFLEQVERPAVSGLSAVELEPLHLGLDALERLIGQAAELVELFFFRIFGHGLAAQVYK